MKLSNVVERTIDVVCLIASFAVLRRGVLFQRRFPAAAHHIRQEDAARGKPAFGLFSVLRRILPADCHF